MHSPRLEGYTPQKEHFIHRRLYSRGEKKPKKQNRETLKTILLSAKQCKLNLVNGYGLQEATGVKLLLPFSPPPLISPLYLNVDKE